MKIAIKIFYFLVLFLPIVSCIDQQKDKAHVRVAASAVPHAEILEQAVEPLKRRGVALDIIVVDDYNLPNRMLAEKEVDANFFQHAPFLALYRKEFGYPFVSFAKVHLEPMGIYSYKVKDFSALIKNSVVAFSSDPTNQARSLLLLEKAGLITLSKNDITATLQDVKENPLNLKFLEVDPAFLVRTLPDVSLAVITANFALEGGLNPKEALLLEGADSSFVNLLVIRQEDQQNIALLALKEQLLSDETKSFIEKRYQGALIVPTQ